MSTTPQPRTDPADPRSRDLLAAQGLDYAVVDTADAAAFDAWIRSDMRGFHGPRPVDAELAEWRGGMDWRRTIAVTDPTAPAADPVATVQSWVSPLTVPGRGGEAGRPLDAWAISSVTVSPTHAGRGIARAMLEGELRAAATACIPLAKLTVSESTLYGRYGFGPATLAADLIFDRRRVRWIGPRPAGRVDYLPNADAATLVAQLHEGSRMSRVGDVRMWPLRWQQTLGLAEGDSNGKKVRAVRYADADGVDRGVAVLRIVGDDDTEFTEHGVAVDFLLATTDDAYAALWRFVLELPLTSTVTATLRRVDEPVRWMIDDFRAVKVRSYDHEWLRILDVPTALGSRGYARDGEVVLRVEDALGFAAGTFALAVVDGEATVREVAEDEATAPLVLGVADLSSLLLGGVDPQALALAGRIAGPRATVAAFAAMITTPTAPWLGTWY